MLVISSRNRKPKLTDAGIVDLLKRVSEAKLRQYVEALAFPRHYVAEHAENLRARDFMLLSVGPQQFLTALVFDGVFERFPRLRGGVIELGAGWVPE